MTPTSASSPLRVDPAAAVQARLAESAASGERLALQSRSSEQRADDAERRLEVMEVQLRSAWAAAQAAQEAQQRTAEQREALAAASAQVEALKVRCVPLLLSHCLDWCTRTECMLNRCEGMGTGANQATLLARVARSLNVPQHGVSVGASCRLS